MTRLPEEECAFYFAAMAQLDAGAPADLCRAGREYPGRVFARSASPGRATSIAPSGGAGRSVDPAGDRGGEGRSRWDRAMPRFERVSKAGV